MAAGIGFSLLLILCLIILLKAKKRGRFGKDFDEINTLFDAMHPCSSKAAFKDTDSPKGRGHRVLKRKEMSDFVSLDLPPLDEAPVPKKKALQKHAASAAGEEVIKQLLDQADSDVEDGSITFNLDSVVLESGDATRVKELEAKLEEAVKRVKELEEANAALQKKLPTMVLNLQRCVDRLMGPTSNFTQRLPSVTVSPVVKDTDRPRTLTVTPKTPTPSSPTVKTETPLPETTEISESLEEFEVNKSLVHRAMQAKDKSKLVCNLLRCFFSRREMATSSLVGKDYAKGKKVLDSKRVEAIINTVQKRYPDCERAYVRTRITQKLKDERRAFFSGNETEG